MPKLSRRARLRGDISMTHTEEELTPLARRMIAASSLGIFIQQENGHRYISIDVRELQVFAPDAINSPELAQPDYFPTPGFCPDCGSVIMLKEYGSFTACLNRIDKIIAPLTLLERFAQMNHYDDNKVFIGTAKVE